MSNLSLHRLPVITAKMESYIQHLIKQAIHFEKQCLYNTLRMNFPFQKFKTTEKILQNSSDKMRTLKSQVSPFKLKNLSKSSKCGGNCM